jgi:hypothetical protein
VAVAHEIDEGEEVEGIDEVNGRDLSQDGHDRFPEFVPLGVVEPARDVLGLLKVDTRSVSQTSGAGWGLSRCRSGVGWVHAVESKEMDFSRRCIALLVINVLGGALSNLYE